MTGSGKTGLVTVLVEEVMMRAGVPVLVIDIKGDLPNLKLGLQREVNGDEAVV